MKQILRLMGMPGGLTSEEALAFLERRGRRLLGTQLIEDGFKRQRRAEQNQINRLGRAARTFGILTSRRILGKVHQFDEIEVSQLNLEEGEVLSATAYKGNPKSAELPFSSVISTRPGTDWYSPSSSDECQIHADHALLAFARTEGRLGDLPNRWLGCLLRGGRTIVRRTGPGNQWFFALGEVTDSACLGWPAEEVNEHGVKLFRPKLLDVWEVSFLVVLSLDDWQGHTFEWKSTMWLRFRHAGLERHGVVAVPLESAPCRFMVWVALPPPPQRRVQPIGSTPV